MTLRLAAAALLAAVSVPAIAQTAPAIDPANLTETVRTLASDQFQGRAPGTVRFPRPGSYTLRVAAEGFTPGRVTVTAPTYTAVDATKVSALQGDAVISYGGLEDD